MELSLQFTLHTLPSPPNTYFPQRRKGEHGSYLFDRGEGADVVARKHVAEDAELAEHDQPFGVRVGGGACPS